MSTWFSDIFSTKCDSCRDEIRWTNNKQQEILMKVSELNTTLMAISAQLDTAKTEILAKLAAAQDPDVPLEIQTLLIDLSAKTNSSYLTK